MNINSITILVAVLIGLTVVIVSFIIFYSRLKKTKFVFNEKPTMKKRNYYQIISLARMLNIFQWCQENNLQHHFNFIMVELSGRKDIKEIPEYLSWLQNYNHKKLTRKQILKYSLQLYKDLEKRLTIFEKLLNDMIETAQKNNQNNDETNNLRDCITEAKKKIKIILRSPKKRAIKDQLWDIDHNVISLFSLISRDHPYFLKIEIEIVFVHIIMEMLIQIY